MFIAGIVIYNNPVTKDLIRAKLKAETASNIYVYIYLVFPYILELTNHSTLIELLIYWKSSGRDSTSTSGDDKCKSKWGSTCELSL